MELAPSLVATMAEGGRTVCKSRINWLAVKKCTGMICVTMSSLLGISADFAPNRIGRLPRLASDVRRIVSVFPSWTAVRPFFFQGAIEHVQRFRARQQLRIPRIQRPAD